HTLSDRNFTAAFPAILALFLIRTGVRNTLVPLYGGHNLGMGPWEIGILLTVAGITTAATMVPVGNWSDRIGRRTPLILALVLSAPVTLCLPLTKDFFQLIVAMAVYGAIIGLSGPIA